MIQSNGSLENARLEARRVLVTALAAAFTDPQSHTTQPLSVEALRWLSTAWRIMAAPYAKARASELGIGELPPVTGNVTPLRKWLALPPLTRAEVMQRVFGLVISRLCPPYETEYCHWKDATYRANQLADVAGFYRAFGVEPDPDHPERHDHVALELAFLAVLLDRRRQAATPDQTHVTINAMEHFYRDHLAWWLPTFARCLERRIEQLTVPSLDSDLRRHLHALHGVATFLRAWAAAERLANGVTPSRQNIAPQVQTPEPVIDMCQTSCDACG